MKNFCCILLFLTFVFAPMRNWAQEEVVKKSAAAILKQALNATDLETALANFQKITADTNSYFFAENEFNRLGYELLAQNKIPEAIGVFTVNAQMFPDSWNAWDSLGEGYIYADNKDLAVRSYEKSLALNPQNENARWTLRRIDSDLAQRRAETQVPFQYQPGEQTGIKGQYLGQKPPGLQPQVFAPGIVSTRGNHEFSCTFSPDGREFYFNRGPDIWMCRWEKDGWTAPEPAWLNTRYLDHEPHLTADGNRLFFGSGRPIPSQDEPGYGIWALERTQAGWGEPTFQFNGMYVTTSKAGTLFSTDWQGNGEADLYRRQLIQGQYQEPEKLTGGVNSDYSDAHPGIAPDESYLIFDSNRPGALGGEYDNDFYLGFRHQDGSWSTAIHLTQISDIGDNMCASISPDGKYIFFYANHDIYWVSAALIGQIKREYFKD